MYKIAIVFLYGMAIIATWIR